MAVNSLSARLDELRSRNPTRLHSENTTGHNTPSFRYSGSFMSPPQSQTPNETPNLQRRFTTDLSKMQNQAMTPIGQPPASSGAVDPSTAVCITFFKFTPRTLYYPALICLHDTHSPSCHVLPRLKD